MQSMRFKNIFSLSHLFDIIKRKMRKIEFNKEKKRMGFLPFKKLYQEKDML